MAAREPTSEKQGFVKKERGFLLSSFDEAQAAHGNVLRKHSTYRDA